jgi:hypothetical protein
MTTALITLSIITSIGIYGLLSTGFQGNIAKMEINEKRIKNIEVKKNRFIEIKDELIDEKTILNGDITKLRDGLSTNTTTQTVDRKTGQLITKANEGNRKSFETQLQQAQVRRDDISKKIDNCNDSITKLDVQILDMESAEIEGSELGAIKYVSEILGWDIKQVANLFILILIFVFDPLAITLVIATNQLFKSNKKENPVDQKTETDNNKKKTQKIWKRVNRLRKEGKLEPPTTEDIINEPTALANSQYRNEYNIEREPLNLDQEINWVQTSEENNDEVNQNIKRLIYKK